jgi:hypothetical protein
MYVFVVGMERCGTHSAINIIRSACKVPHYVVHEDRPFLCREARLIFEQKDFRTPDLKQKIRLLRKRHKNNKLVCEANHRFSFFISLLMRNLGPNCKFIFLVRDPISTLISRISIWSHYQNYMAKYPPFYQEKIAQMTPPFDFNDYRLSPPKTYADKTVAELYLWEWLETYKFARQELATIPRQNRLIMFTEDLTQNFDVMLGFIGMDYFKVDGEVLGWSRTKSDSVYVQEKEKETDVFVTRNRSPHTDETVLYAKAEIMKNKNLISNKITEEFFKLPADIDDDIVAMDKRILKFIQVKMI